MTTSDPNQGRLAARAHRSFKSTFLAVIGLLACATSAPALAESSEIASSAAASSISLLPDAMPRAERVLLMSNDVNRLLAALPTAQLTGQVRAPLSTQMQAVLRGALSLLGTPYRWGGTNSDTGFDCSGLVSYVFEQALGIELPRVSREQARAGRPVDADALSAGDLVFFSRSGRTIDHVGIYVGEGQFVHSPRTGRDVVVSRMDTGYWAGRFKQATRVIES